MSKEEIDWEQVFNEPEEPKPEVDKETLWVQLERMNQASKDLPRWAVFKQLMVLSYLAMWSGLGVYLTGLAELPYLAVIIVFLLGNMYLLADYYVMVHRTKQRARGTRR